jgi:hypothetical protein
MTDFNYTSGGPISASSGVDKVGAPSPTAPSRQRLAADSFA